MTRPPPSSPLFPTPPLFRSRRPAPAPPPADFFPAGKAGFIFGNALFANLGGGRFEEVSDSLGVETYWPWGPSVDDLNADGRSEERRGGEECRSRWSPYH